MIMITIRVIRRTASILKIITRVKDNNKNYNDNNAIERRKNKNINDNDIKANRNHPNDETTNDSSGHDNENGLWLLAPG